MKLREVLSEWLQIASMAFLLLWAWVPINWLGWIVGFGVTLIMMLAAYFLSPSRSWISRLYNLSRARETPIPPEHHLAIGSHESATPPNPPLNTDAQQAGSARSPRAG